jgi:hypothetical protein
VGEESHEKQSTCPSYTKCFYKMFLAESAEVCKELTAYHQCDMTASSSGVSHHGSTFLDEDEECTKRFLAAALAPTTNTFAGTSTEERLQNEILLVREKQRSPTVFQRYAQQNLLSVRAVRPTAKGSEEAELGRQEALLLSQTNQDLFFSI